MFGGENFPYTNFHDLNMDWIIKIVKDFSVQYPEIIEDLNNKMSIATNGNGLAGDILTSNGDGTVTWVSSRELDPELITNAVYEWLNEHPEATTTVEDGSISAAKLSAALLAQFNSQHFVDNLHIRTGAFITNNDTGITSSQGMCVINNRYLVVCRYSGSNRVFKVYDIINKSEVAESTIPATQVGHVNSLTYSNGYIYCTTLEENMGVVRLIVNLETFQIAYDSIATSEVYVALCVQDSDIYGWKVENENWACFKLSPAFSNPVRLFETDFANSMDYISMQGCTTDGTFLYVAISGQYISGNTTPDELKRFTEYVYVFDMTGNIIKTFNMSRGVLGEIEDIEIITVNSQKYIALNFNVNDVGVTSVYIAELLTDTAPVTQFLTTDIHSTIANSAGEDFNIYVSEAIGNDFADGSLTKPFKTINAAITFIKRAAIPAVLFIRDGSFTTLYLRNLDTPLTIFFDDGTVAGVFIYRAGTITFDRTGGYPGTTITGQLTVNETVIMSRTGPNFEGSGIAINLIRSAFIGDLARTLTGYTAALTGNMSFVMASIGTGVTNIQAGAGLRGWVGYTAITP